MSHLPNDAPISVRRYSGRKNTVGRIFSEVLQRTENGVEQALYGPESARTKMLKYIRLAQDNNLHDWARRYVAPILSLFSDQPPVLELTVIRKEAEAEGRENVAGAIAQETNNPVDMLAWAKALEAEAAAELNLAAALRAAANDRGDK